MVDTPPTSKGPASKRTMIDLIVLAFSKSELKDVVGADALRTVLEGRYMDMVRTPGTVNLQPVWDLLQSQAGVSLDKAIPPFCRLKQCEPRLQLTVELPKDLVALGTIQRDRAAQQCKVTEDDLNTIFAPPAPVPREAPAAPSQKVIEEKRQLRLTAGLLAGVVVFVVLIVGGALWFSLKGGPESIDPAQVTTELPIKEVRKTADLIGVILKDRAAWSGKSQEERRRVVSDAMDHSRPLGAQRLVVMDDQGAWLAQASVGEDGKAVVIVK